MSHAKELHDDLRSLVGTVIGERYRVDAVLGVGGMGAVFRGHHVGLRRDVAIKVLHPEIGRDEATSKRFDREARSASRLDHDNCVRVTDYGSTAGGTKYLVMELLEGIELKVSLGIPMVPGRATELAIQMFNGLDHAHHHGIVHRDLKPENVFLTHDFRGDELVKIVDFGIAKIMDSDASQERLTRTGLVFGTPSYMSPEQASGDSVDHRADLYAAGLILYEMLAGRPPFFADTTAELMRMQLMAPPAPLPNEIPHKLATIVAQLLEKNPGKRQDGAREVVQSLEAILPELDGLPPAAAPVGVIKGLAAGGPSQSTTAATTAARSGSSDEETRQTRGVSSSTAADSLTGASRGSAPSGDRADTGDSGENDSGDLANRASRSGTRPTAPASIGRGRADTSRPSVRVTAGPAAHTSASGSVVAPAPKSQTRPGGRVVLVLGIVGLLGVAGAYLLITFGPDWLTGAAGDGLNANLPSPDELESAGQGEAEPTELVPVDERDAAVGEPTDPDVQPGTQESGPAEAGSAESRGASMLDPLINPFGALGGQTHEDVLRPSGPDPETRPSFPFGGKTGSNGGGASTGGGEARVEEPAGNEPADPAPGAGGEPSPSDPKQGGKGSDPENPQESGNTGEENAPKQDPGPNPTPPEPEEQPASDKKGGKKKKKKAKKPKKKTEPASPTGGPQ